VGIEGWWIGRALDLEANVVQPGGVGRDQLELVVLLVRGQQRFAVGPCPHTEAEDALHVLDRTLQVSDT